MPVQLTRDCEATQVPSGEITMLPGGLEVDITQSLGGGFTVRAMTGGLFRIAQKDADALGLGQSKPPPASETPPSGPLDEQKVWEVLRTCYDPEIPVNIVDLGLVYAMRMTPLPSGASSVAVSMTLTAPGCGMGEMIAGDAQMKLAQLPGVEIAGVQIVWEPPWHPGLISAEGRRILGLDEP